LQHFHSLPAEAELSVQLSFVLRTLNFNSLFILFLHTLLAKAPKLKMSHPVSTVVRAETKMTPNSTVAKTETKMTPDSTVAKAHPAIYASLAKAPIEIPGAGETFSR